MDHNNSSNTLANIVGVIDGVAKEILESWTLYISQGIENNVNVTRKKLENYTLDNSQDKKIDSSKVSLKILKAFWKPLLV